MVIFTSSLCYVRGCKPVIRLLNADLFNPLKAPTFNTRRVFAPFPEVFITWIIISSPISSRLWTISIVKL